MKGSRVEPMQSWLGLSHADYHVTVFSKIGAKIHNSGPATMTRARNHISYLPRGERLSAPDTLLSQSGWGIRCMADPTRNDAGNGVWSLGVMVHGDRH
jgi:hypothetical protein